MRFNGGICLRVKLWAIAILFVTILSFTFGACEPTNSIHIINQTDETLKIYIGDAVDDVFLGNAAPGKEVKWRIETIYSSYLINARSTDGVIIYSRSIPKEELEENRWRVVITPAQINIE